MTSETIDAGELTESAELIVTSLISGLEIKRAGIWIYKDHHRATLKACLIIDRHHQTRDSTTEITRTQYPAYFNALDEEILINANNAATNPLTSEFRHGYLDVLNIHSMLDAPIRINGKTVGVVCCEHIGSTKVWNEDDMLFASLLADQFGRSMAAEEKISQYRKLVETSRALDEQTANLKAIHTSLNKFSLISSTDVNGVITDINDNFLTVSDYSREEVLGNTHRIFNSDYHPNNFFAELWYQITQGAIWQGRICNRKKNGEIFWIDATISPVKNLLGKIEGFIGLYHEITHEIDTQVQLQEAEKLSGSGSFRYNPKTDQWMATENFKNLFSIGLNQTISWTIFKNIFSKNDFEKFKNSVFGLSEKSHFELIVKTTSSPTLWLQFTGKKQGLWVLGSCQNISQRVKQDYELNRTIAFQKTILNSANFSIIATTPDGTITHFNNMAEKLLGYKPDELIGQLKSDIFHLKEEILDYSSELEKKYKQKITAGIETLIFKPKLGIVDEREWTYITKYGKTFPVSLSVTAIFNDKEKIIGYLGIGKDLTKQKEIEKYSAQLNNILATAGTIASFSGFLYDVNKAEFVITNEHFREQVLQQTPNKTTIDFADIQSMFAEPHRATIATTLEQAIRFGTEFDIQVQLSTAANDPGNWLRIAGTAQYEDNSITSILGFIQNITEQKQLEEKLSSLALTDELTNTANRRSLMIQLTNEWKRHARYQSSASVLILDIDHFKAVNDRLGHDAGDYALQCFSFTVKEQLRDSDIFGRFGGEEFLILAPNSEESTAVKLAEKIRKSIATSTMRYTPPFQSNAIEIGITVSIGVCGLSERISSLSRWLAAADKSLYTAKQTGRNRVVSYQSL